MSLFKTSNKSINQIPNLLQLKLIKNLSQQFIKAAKKIAIIIEKYIKKKTTTKPITIDNRCLNYY